MENQDELVDDATPESCPGDPLRIEPSVLVSYAPLVTQTTVELKPLSEVIEEIRSSDKLKAMIELVRAEKDKPKRQDLKNATLPYFTFSHLKDNKRNGEHFKYARFIPQDIDHIAERLEELEKAFRADSHIFLFYRSPSGDGLRVAFALSEFAADDKSYRNTFISCANYLKEKYGISIDTSTINPSQPYYLSSDPNIYVNWNPVPFDVVVDNHELTYNLTENKKENKPSIVDLHKGASIGDRTNTLVKLATFYKSEGRDCALTIETLKGWNLRNNPPLTEEKVVKTVEDIFKRENYGIKKAVRVPQADPEEIVYNDVANLQTEPIVYTPNLITGWMKVYCPPLS